MPNFVEYSNAQTLMQAIKNKIETGGGSGSGYIPTKPVHIEDVWLDIAFDESEITDRSYIWSDGTNTYYSNNSKQYQYDKSDHQWYPKTWNGFNPDGRYIWTDGENIYYSYQSTHYVLDKSTSTWSAKTWSGLNTFVGNHIWSDGTDTYYSYSSTNFVLNKETSKWTTKTWTGLTNFDGQYVWTDGTDIYYSYNSNQYVLDKSTSTWNSKTWSGLTSFTASTIWKRGNDIYLSIDSSVGNYELNKSTSTWSAKSWIELSRFSGTNVWTDGTDIYYLKTASSVRTSKILTYEDTVTIDGIVDVLYSGLASNTDITFADDFLEYERIIIKTRNGTNGHSESLVSYSHNDLVIYYSDMLETGMPTGFGAVRYLYLPIMYTFDCKNDESDGGGYLKFDLGGTGSANLTIWEFYSRAVLYAKSDQYIEIYGIKTTT